MKKFFKVTLLLFLLFFSPLTIYAHPGGTDANGGHYNRSTGEYHYHHGYPAHQHENGECPYDFDDKTGWNSGNSSGTSNHNEVDTQSSAIVESNENDFNKALFIILENFNVISAFLFAAIWVHAILYALLVVVFEHTFKNSAFDIEKLSLYSSFPISIFITILLQIKFDFMSIFSPPALIILMFPVGILGLFYFGLFLVLITKSIFNHNSHQTANKEYNQPKVEFKAATSDKKPILTENKKTTQKKFKSTTCYANPIGPEPPPITVYVTKSGKKYHTMECPIAYGKSREITLSDAKRHGYTPCSKCNPPR